VTRQVPSKPGTRASRIGWFVLLWAVGVLAVAVVAYGLKAWIAV